MGRYQCDAADESRVGCDDSCVGGDGKHAAAPDESRFAGYKGARPGCVAGYEHLIVGSESCPVKLVAHSPVPR